MNIPYVFKRCTKCGRWLVASSVNFNKGKRGKYGLKSQCKECGKKYREANKEALTEYQKKYYEANKEVIAERRKEYRNANKDIITERKKRYYEANKDGISKRMKKYRNANKEVIAERNKRYKNTPQGQVMIFNQCSRRRAREQNQGSGITKEQWLEMMNFFNWECAYSGKRLTNKTRSIDHITPLNKGGKNEIWNCVPMDRSLNSSKQDKEILEWYIKQPFYSDDRLKKILEWQEYAKNKYDNFNNN